MSSGLGLSATLVAVTSAAIAAPAIIPPETAAAVSAAVPERAAVDQRAGETRLEVWTSPKRIRKLKPRKSRTIRVLAMETKAEWRIVGAVIHARTTAGKITPKRATARAGRTDGVPFRLTRSSDDPRHGFVVFTATSQKYGVARSAVSWGKVVLPRTLTGMLTHTRRVGGPGSGLPYVHWRDEWNVTFRLASRNSRGMARYELGSGTWSAKHESETLQGGQDCVGQGTGPAAAGTLRYDWRGTGASPGIGSHLIDVSSTATYRVWCLHHMFDARPAFTLGFQVAFDVPPSHLKGSRTRREGTSSVESWRWDLRR